MPLVTAQGEAGQTRIELTRILMPVEAGIPRSQRPSSKALFGFSALTGDDDHEERALVEAIPRSMFKHLMK